MNKELQKTPLSEIALLLLMASLVGTGVPNTTGASSPFVLTNLKFSLEMS